MDLERNPSQDYWTIKAMTTYGGGFVKALGHAAAQADENNLRRIKAAFPEYWKQYADMGTHLETADAAKRIKQS